MHFNNQGDFVGDKLCINAWMYVHCLIITIVPLRPESIGGAIPFDVVPEVEIFWLVYLDR